MELHSYLTVMSIALWKRFCKSLSSLGVASRVSDPALKAADAKVAILDLLKFKTTPFCKEVEAFVERTRF